MRAPADDRALPSSLDAEKAVLGAILLHPSAYERVAARLRPRDFYRVAHQLVYQTMVKLVEQRVTCDFVTLSDALRQAGDLDNVGGPAYLSALVDGLPQATNIGHYAEIVREKALLRALIYSSTAAVTAAYEDATPATEILRTADRALLALQGRASPDALTAMKPSVSALMDDLERRVAHKGQLWGIDTGFKSINAETMGWQKGDLIVIAARPSMGKTTFVLNSTLAAAKSGKTAAVFSLEMRREQLDYRLLSGLSTVPSRRMLTGYLSPAEYGQLGAGLTAYGDLPIYIDDRPAQTIGDIRLACRRLRHEGPLDLVVIDYVQLIPGTLDRRGATRNDEITDISARSKALAGELGVPVLLLSQLKRIGGQRPQLEDLRECGALEQDADLVCFLHRKNHKEGGLTNFIIEKARNGPTGTVNLSLDRDTTTFTDAGDETPEQASAAETEHAQAQRTRAIIRQRAKSR